MADVSLPVKGLDERNVVRLARILAVFFVALLTTLALIPDVGAVGPAPPDWFLHATAYGVFSAILLVATGRFRPLDPVAAAAALGGATLFGVLTEVLQLMVSWRSFELMDILADGCGALLFGGTAAWLLGRSAIDPVEE